MSEKVPFFRSTAFTNLVAAAFLFILCYTVQDIESLSDWSWWDCSCVCMVGIVCSLVKFFWLCGKRVCSGRWYEEKRGRKWADAFGLGLMILILGIVVVLRPKLDGPRETIDGVTWRYVVEDGHAVIKRKKNSFDRPAISVTTSGALEIPAKLGGYPVVGVGRDAFRGCRKLTSVTIPESVRYLDWESFKNCRALRKVIVRGDLRWMGDAFGGCGELKEFVVDPENKYLQSVDGMLLNKAGTRLIAGPGGNVRIPEGVSCIDSFAFARRDGLKSVTLPNSVTNIGREAFSRCKNLAAVAIPKGVSAIDFGTFQDCEGLTSVTLPDGVRSISAFAFKGCRSLTTLKLPESVTGIRNDAFRNCRSLVSVNVPSNVIQIGKNAFAGTPFLDGRPDGLVVFSGIVYRWKGRCPTEVVIPDGVTRIFDKAFYYRNEIRSVKIPKTVKSIGDSAFSSCDGLTSMIIPEGVTNIGHAAFYCCDKLTAVTLPKSLTKVSGHPFLGTNIRTVYVVKGDVERVKSMAEDLHIRVNSKKWKFGSNEVKFVECDEFPSAIGE